MEEGSLAKSLPSSFVISKRSRVELWPLRRRGELRAIAQPGRESAIDGAPFSPDDGRWAPTMDCCARTTDNPRRRRAVLPGRRTLPADDGLFSQDDGRSPPTTRSPRRYGRLRWDGGGLKGERATVGGRNT